MNYFKRILLTLFIFSTFIILDSSSKYLLASTSLKNYAPKYGVTLEKVNIRQGSSTTAKLLKTIEKGANLKIVAETTDFYIVQLSSNEVGAVTKKYIKASNISPKGASLYYNMNIKTAIIKEKIINLRSGPGVNFKLISSLQQNTEVKVIGYIDDFYMVITNNNTVGMIKKDLLSFVIAPSTVTPTIPITKGDTNEELILSYINNERVKAKMPLLKMDNALLKIARLKAIDMTTNKYFAHNSPKHGSPFKMMQDNKIDYRAAGENIAGNPNLKAAVDAWMKSPAHRENILSNAYNYIGIGISKSDIYGYVISAMFIGR